MSLIKATTSHHFLAANTLTAITFNLPGFNSLVKSGFKASLSSEHKVLASKVLIPQTVTPVVVDIRGSEGSSNAVTHIDMRQNITCCALRPGFNVSYMCES